MSDGGQRLYEALLRCVGDLEVVRMDEDDPSYPELARTYFFSPIKAVEVVTGRRPRVIRRREPVSRADLLEALVVLDAAAMEHQHYPVWTEDGWTVSLACLLVREMRSGLLTAICGPLPEKIGHETFGSVIHYDDDDDDD